MRDSDLILKINNIKTYKQLVTLAVKDFEFIMKSDPYYSDFRMAWIKKAKRLLRRGER
jgi:hypothetical protein